MEKENALLIKEIMQNLNWKERIVAKIFKDIFIKIYKVGIAYGFNNK